MSRAQNLRRVLVIAAVVVSGLFVQSAVAGSVTTVILDASHQTNGSHGDSFRPMDSTGNIAGMLLRARTSSPANPQTLSGQSYHNRTNANGSIWIGRGGLEVRPAHDGRTGAYRDQIAFNLDQPSFINDTRLGLRSFGFGMFDAEPESYLTLNIFGEDDAVVLGESALQAAFVNTGQGTGYIDFGNLGLGDALIESFSFGGMQGNLSMTFATFSAAALPLPTALMVGLVGIAGVVILRRRVS